MQYVIGILPYKSFIELPELNQAFGEKQGLFNFPGHVKQREKSMQYNA